MYFDFNEQEGRDPATIDFSTFDEETYRVSRWPRLNALANNLGGNFQLLPDEGENSLRFKIIEETLNRRVRESSLPL